MTFFWLFKICISSYGTMVIDICRVSNLADIKNERYNLGKCRVYIIASQSLSCGSCTRQGISYESCSDLIGGTEGARQIKLTVLLSKLGACPVVSHAAQQGVVRSVSSALSDRLRHGTWRMYPTGVSADSRLHTIYHLVKLYHAHPVRGTTQHKANRQR
jgi:hypothetical protein